MLLSNCTSGGCGAKIGPGELGELLSGLPTAFDPNLIVGFDNSDDAAVYRLNDDLHIVSTVDFFSPMVDDPVTFGRIAAANALSDVYAMGATPIFALNLVCFPEKMDKKILADILRGGSEKLQEAGAALAGGHSIYDKEIKYGLSVTGKLEGKPLRNDACRVGDALILTKPLGVGIILAAARGGEADEEAIATVTASMERLNKYAAEQMNGYDISAATDVTGFGLIAHLAEMVGSHASALLEPSALPYFAEAYKYANEFLLTAAGQRNRTYMAEKTDVSALPFALQELLFDPQTSGGLLIAVAHEQANDLLAAIQKYEPKAAIIGAVTEKADRAVMFA